VHVQDDRRDTRGAAGVAPASWTSQDFAAAPWRAIDVARIPQLPAMLGQEERQFLYWVANRYVRGRGALLDLGGFLGASAACMAAGLADRAPLVPPPALITFDFFEHAPFYESFLPPAAFSPGQDMVPHVRQLLGMLASRVEFVKGDICAQGWRGGPIEVLFVDFTQTWEHHEHVVRTFYPHLVPGESLLIHQDYVHTVGYWLHLFMAHHASSFEQVSPLIHNATAAWLLVRPLPPSCFTSRLQDELSFPEMCDLLDDSIARYTAPHDVLLRCARTRMVLHFRGADAARAHADALVASYGDDPVTGPHVHTLANEVLTWTHGPILAARGDPS
jgi:hypothetical protein